MRSESVPSPNTRKNPQRPPGPPPWTALHNLRRFQKQPLAFLGELDARYGGIVRFPTALLPVYLVSDPDAVKWVLQDHYKNYNKNTFVYNMARALGGTNLLTSDGADWLRRRRMLQPILHRNYIVHFADTMTSLIEEMLVRWSIASGPLDLVEEMMRLTMRIAGKTLFSVDLDQEAAEIRAALNTSTDEVFNQFRSPLAAIWTLLGFPPPSSARFRQSQARLDDLLYGLIADRRQQNDLPNDVLSMLLQAVDEETGRGMSDEEIRSEIGTLLTAGHETTALALTWTWILLAQNPTVEARLHEEVEAQMAGDIATVEELASLSYTNALFQEALRLYPPVWGFSRRAIADDEVCGFRIPAGARIMLSPYVTHHSRHYWTDPEQFDPTRFLSGGEAEGRKSAHIPFGGGPRGCIGNSFALMEARLVIASVAHRYRLQLVRGDAIHPSTQGTLRPERPVFFHPVPRPTNGSP